jgi:hypothetical protein
VLLEAIEAAGFTPGDDIAIALDPAVSEIYRDGRYHLDGEGKVLVADELVAYWIRLVDSTRSCRSRTAWPRTTGTAGRRAHHGSATACQLVGDDLFVTNSERLQRGIDRGVANSVLIKVNQIGTLTETLDTVELATRTVHLGDEPPQRRDRGHHHRRPRGGHQLRPDQDRVRRPAATGSPSTTSCCASRPTSARRPRSAAATRSHRAGAAETV